MKRPNDPPKLKQVLPRARYIPRFSRDAVSDEWKERLTDIALKAYKRTEQGKREGDEADMAFPVIFAPVRAQSAVEWYLSAKFSETKIPEFRKQSAALGKAVDRFVNELPATDSVSPWAQMHALYCSGGDAESNGVGGSPEEIDQYQRREDLWDTQLSPAVVRVVLMRWQEMLDQLRALTGTGRTDVEAEIRFVGALATYWVEELRAHLGSSRAPEPDSRSEQGSPRKKAPTRERGLFADFVRAAAELIALAGIRMPSLDHAIKQVVAKHRQS